METNLRGLIDDVICKFRRNRVGPQPKILLKVPPDLPLIFWHDDGLNRFVKTFLYHALMVNNPETPVQILVHDRSRLADLESFVKVFPLCWIQLRIEGHGPGMIEGVAEEILKDHGYRCEEWVGVEGSDSQLAIFSPIDGNEAKLVLCFNIARGQWKCDFLIPVSENLLLPASSGARRKQ
jgi:hypothetical protein